MTRLREIRIRSKRVDPTQLRGILAEIDLGARIVDDEARPCPGARKPALEFIESTHEPRGAPSEGPAPGGMVVLPTESGGTLEAWIASVAARRLRRVGDVDRCASPGLDDVLHAGRWLHPDTPDLDGDGSSGVLVVKPGILPTPAFLAEVAARLAECGYGIVEARSIPAERLRELGLARAHYRSHCAFAEHGRLTPAERTALLRAYDTREFERTHGRCARGVPVVAVERFIAGTGVPRDVIRRWSDDSTAARGLDSVALDGPTELGDDKYVNVFRDPVWTPDGPVFLINAHMPSVIAWWEESPSPRLALLLTAMAPQALPWHRLRREFCGASDAALARPGSLRRDGLEGVLHLSLEQGQGVDRTHNIVHLSNGPIEAMRETALWFDRPLADQPAGRTLMTSTGLDSDAIHDAAHLALDGVVRPFTAATAGLTVMETAACIARGRVHSADALGCTSATLARIDAARTLVPTLLADAPLTAVLISGSTARNRASADSDVDLVIVTECLPDVRTQRREMRGMLFECEWMTEARARRIAAGGEGDLKGLREASRLACALALHDPGALAGELRETANAVSPSLPGLDERLLGAISALDELVEHPERSAPEQWETLREIQDALAVSQLSLHPIRYQKPKWVIADLEEIGSVELAAALLRSYDATRDDDLVRRTLAGVEALLAAIARTRDLPTFGAVLARGFVERFPGWSYTCRTLADARSLHQDGSPAAADYTAKFAARLALRVDADESARVSRASTEESREPVLAYRNLFTDAMSTPPTEGDLETAVEWSTLVMQARVRLLER